MTVSCKHREAPYIAGPAVARATNRLVTGSTQSAGSPSELDSVASTRIALTSTRIGACGGVIGRRSTSCRGVSGRDSSRHSRRDLRASRGT
jgi:hypothetical protein